MADLSSYAPIYVRVDGDDETGDGSLAAPFATPQRAFEAAYWNGGAKPTPETITITITIEADGTASVSGTFTNPADNSVLAYSVSYSSEAPTDLWNLTSNVLLAIRDNCWDAVEIVAFSEVDGTIVVRNRSFTASVQPTITGNGSLTTTASTGIKTISTASYVLDIGAGSFPPVIVRDAEATEWPSRIAIRGAGKTASIIGGVNGSSRDILIFNTDYGLYSAYQNIGPTPSRPVHIISDKTVQLGNVETTGGYADTQYGLPLFGYSGQAGSDVTLVDCVAGDITTRSTTGFYDPGNSYDYDTDSGDVTISGCEVGNVDTSVGAGMFSTSSLGDAGNITVTNSTTGSITARNIFDGNNGYYPGLTGNVTVANSQTGNIEAGCGISLDGGYAESARSSNGGTVVITDSVVGDINAGHPVEYSGYDAYTSGDVTVERSTTGDIATNCSNEDSTYSAYTQAGTVTITDSVVGNIDAYGFHRNGGAGYGSGQAGDVVITKSVCGTVDVHSEYLDSNYTYRDAIFKAGSITAANSKLGDLNAAPNGIVTLSGDIPLTFDVVNCGTLDMTAVNKGRGVNGSSILGVA